MWAYGSEWRYQAYGMLLLLEKFAHSFLVNGLNQIALFILRWNGLSRAETSSIER